MESRVSLKYFVNGCLWKQFFACNSPKTTLNLISLIILVTLRLFTQFYPKIRANKLQESDKTCLTLQLLFRSFHGSRNLILKDFQVCFRKF